MAKLLLIALIISVLSGGVYVYKNSIITEGNAIGFSLSESRGSKGSVDTFKTKSCYMHEDVQILENEKSDLTMIQYDHQKRLNDLVAYQRGQMLTEIASTTAQIKKLEAMRKKSATTTAEIKALKEESSRIRPGVEAKVKNAKDLLAGTQKQLSTNARNLQTASGKLCKKQDIETVSFVESDFVVPNMSCYTADNINEYRRRHARLTAFLKHSPSLIQQYMRSDKVTYDRMIKNRDIANKYQFTLLDSIRLAENNRCRSGQQGAVVTPGINNVQSGTGNIQTTGYCSDGGYTTQSSCENATIRNCADDVEDDSGNCQEVNAGYTWIEDDTGGGDVCEADTMGSGWKINGSFFGFNKGNTLCGSEAGQCIKGATVDGDVSTSRGNDPGTFVASWTCAKDDATGKPECRFTESCSKIID
jgi:hypothetical protein